MLGVKVYSHHLQCYIAKHGWLIRLTPCRILSSGRYARLALVGGLSVKANGVSVGPLVFGSVKGMLAAGTAPGVYLKAWNEGQIGQVVVDGTEMVLDSISLYTDTSSKISPAQFSCVQEFVKGSASVRCLCIPSGRPVLSRPTWWAAVTPCPHLSPVICRRPLSGKTTASTAALW